MPSGVVCFGSYDDIRAQAPDASTASAHTCFRAERWQSSPLNRSVGSQRPTLHRDGLPLELPVSGEQRKGQPARGWPMD